MTDTVAFTWNSQLFDQAGGGGSGPAVRAAEGPYADHPLSALVLHINREAIHHGAEIALLRDLYLRQDLLRSTADR